MTTKEMMKALYSNAESVWGEFHNGICPRSVSVMYEGTEYRIFSEDKPILEEVQRRLEMSEWHTGTPTEEGLYIVYYWDDHNPLGVEYEAMCDVMVQPVFDDDGELECWVNDDRDVRFEADDIIRWQRIDPYKEASE